MIDRARSVPQKDKLFPRFALDYFRQLRQQYELLLDETHATAVNSVERVIAKVDGDPGHTTWADVFLIETAYLYALPDERLAAEVVRFRNRYRGVAGNEAYATYLQGVHGDPAASPAPDLRAELLTLGERICYLYTFVPAREVIRNKLAIGAASLTIVCAALFAAGAAALYAAAHAVPTILVVGFAGMLGGFLSVQQRLQASDDVDPLFKELQLTAGWFSVVVLAPFSGSVFAIVLYWLFLAGLLNGGLFPQFATGTPPAGGFDLGAFLSQGAPQAVTDFGKLLAWAFTAGFAERLVPDVLTRLTTQVAGAAKKAPPLPASRTPQQRPIAT